MTTPTVRALWIGIGALMIAAWLLPARADADVESDLQASFAGRYALVRGSLVSECTDHFTNLQVAAGRIAGGTGTRFESGELVYIDKVSIGLLTGLDVNLTINEPFLLSWEDGPFTVYDQRRCRAQLNFEVGRDVRRDRAKARAAIEGVLEVFDSEPAARHGQSWNGRRVKPYPKDWERTRVEYEKYRMARRNELVRQKTEDVLHQANQVLTYMKTDEEYLLSFGAGAEARSDYWSDCDSMLSATFSTSGSGKNYQGYADGQKVAWATHLAEALQDCYITPPR